MFDGPFAIILTFLAIYILVQLNKIKKGISHLARLEDRLLDLQREVRQQTKSLVAPPSFPRRPNLPLPRKIA